MSETDETRKKIVTREDLLEDMDEYQRKALEDILNKKNIFLTGAGGCGKTFLLRRLHEWLLNQEFERAAITSTTGITALLIGGRTVASFFGFGVEDKPPPQMWELIRKKTYYHKPMRDLTILVIDEVSMLSAQTFESIDYVLRCVKKKNDKPFAGVQIILCGDFLQLEPVKGQFCFRSPIWNLLELQYHCLRGGHRQAQDEVFRHLLKEVRQGEISPFVRNELSQRLLAPLENLPEGLVPAELYPRRAEAEKSNLTHLVALEGLDYIYQAKIKWPNYGKISRNVKAIEAVEKNLRKNMVTPDNLMLKIGAQVMLTRNLDLHRGLANGSLGIVKGIKTREELIEEDKEHAKQLGMAYCDKGYAHEDYPVVLFANGRVETITEKKWEYKDLIEKYHVQYIQVPLMLAYSLTVHKVILKITFSE